jgi:hypothetical protein
VTRESTPIRKATLAAERIAEEQHEEHEIGTKEHYQQPKHCAPAERLRKRTTEQWAKRDTEQWRSVVDARHLSTLCGIVDVREGGCADCYEGTRAVRAVGTEQKTGETFAVV